MPDLKEQFKKQNKIFDIYMKNASIGIVVIECNYKEIGMQICEYMHTSYCLQCVDYMDLKEGIVEYLRKIGNSENEQENHPEDEEHLHDESTTNAKTGDESNARIWNAILIV